MWTEFVQLSQYKRRKRESARNFAKGKLLRNAWRGWSQYILARRGKKEMKAQVEQWSIVRIKRCVNHITLYLHVSPIHAYQIISNKQYN